MKNLIVVLTALMALYSCQQNEIKKTNVSGNQQDSLAISCPPGSTKLDIATIEQITGIKGQEKIELKYYILYLHPKCINC